MDRFVSLVKFSLDEFYSDYKKQNKINPKEFPYVQHMLLWIEKLNEFPKECQ